MIFKIPKIIYNLPENSYIVGGAVRDLVRGDIPSDIDITTSATPDELLALFPDAVTLGIKFGTVIVDDIEITTMRKDMTSGRHPNVSYTTDLYEDLARRDFSMNAMTIPLHGSHTTENITDPFNGIGDIGGCVLRCVGLPGMRMKEDPLRALRAVRFASKYKFRIADEVLRAMSFITLDEVSNERIRDELMKSFKYNATNTIELLHETGLLHEILPEVQHLRYCEHDVEHHPEGDAYEHTLKALRYADLNDFTPIQKIAVLLHDIGKGAECEYYSECKYPGHAGIGVEIAKTILNRLKFSGGETKEILFAVKNHMKAHDLSNMKKSKRYSMYRCEYFETLLRVHEADCNGRKDSNVQYAELDISLMPPIVECFVNGHDLMEMGYEAGPKMGKVLKDIKERQIDGDIKDKYDALSYALRYLFSELDISDVKMDEMRHILFDVSKETKIINWRGL